MGEMTSRERVRKALKHEEPDRIPMDFVPLLETYKNLKEYLGFDFEEELNPGKWTNVEMHPKVMDSLGIDIVHLGPGKPKNWSPTVYSDGSVDDEWGVRRKKVSHGDSYYNEIVKSPLADADIDDLDDYLWPDPDDPGRVEGLREKAKRIYQDTDYSILARFGGNVNEGCTYFRGFEQWLVDYMINQEFVEKLLDIVIDIQFKINKNCLREAGEYIDILRLGGEDMGTQNSLLYPPDKLREIWFPRLKELITKTKREFHKYNPDGKIMLHSCGAIYPIIEDLIDCGVDVLNPIQPMADGMDTKKMNEDFGDRLTFHGAIGIQEVLPNYSQDEVEEFVKGKINDLGPGGGYILSPAHNVPEDCRAENIVRMCDTVKKYGRYPLV